MTGTGVAATTEGAVWRALADPTRRRLLDLLRDGPRTTGQLAEEFDTTRFAVMKHLGVLEDAGLVLVRRKGRERWNHLNAVAVRDAIDRWVEPFADRLATSLLRLRDAVEPDRTEPTNAYGGTMQTATVRSIEVELEIPIAAPPARVFDALTAGIGGWWTHGFFGGSVYLEPWVGGRFYEDGAGGAALFGHVAALVPGRHLRINGPMGMTGPVAGSITFELVEADGGAATTLRLSHGAFGDLDEDTEQSYATGWKELLGSALVEHLRATA